MSSITITNWFGDVISHPAVVADATCVEDIVEILKERDRYPSPVRAVGSNHSMTRCGTADGGTLIRMKMNRILDINDDTVTAEAGALYIDIAKELEKRNLQFHVNTEIGCLSAGSAACAGSKDSSMNGEYGQVGSYVTAVKMVLPNGRLLTVTERDEPELMKRIRCSYGTFGILYEVTFRTRPLTAIKVRHRTFEIEEFLKVLPALRETKQAMMMYVFPHTRKITIELREYSPNPPGKPNRKGFAIRNQYWAVTGPMVASLAARYAYFASVRALIQNAAEALWRWLLRHRVSGDHMIPPDQIIRYPPKGGASRYKFTFWAFPEERYPQALRDFCTFCEDHFTRTGYRTNVLCVGYALCKDQQSLLSYSYDGPIITIDPVTTENPGWSDFIAEFNRFASDHGAIPLLNQTPDLKPELVQRIFGERLRLVEETRRFYDPDGRLLSDYFAQLFGSASMPVAPREAAAK